MPNRNYVMQTSSAAANHALLDYGWKHTTSAKGAKSRFAEIHKRWIKASSATVGTGQSATLTPTEIFPPSWDLGNEFKLHSRAKSPQVLDLSRLILRRDLHGTVLQGISPGPQSLESLAEVHFAVASMACWEKA